MGTMLAGRLHLDTRTFAVEEVHVPVPGPGEVLVEARAAGVCLSDVHLIDGSLSPFLPADAVADARAVTLGHEVAGVVHTLGSEAEHLEQLVGLAAAGRIDLAPSTTARNPLAEAADAVARLEKKTGDPIRLVLTP